MYNSTSDTDSENEVFFGPVKPKESPLVDLYSRRKTEVFTTTFRRSTKTVINSLNKTLYLDENIEIGAEEFVETTAKSDSPRKSIYLDENFILGAEEIVEFSSEEKVVEEKTVEKESVKDETLLTTCSSKENVFVNDVKSEFNREIEIKEHLEPNALTEPIKEAVTNEENLNLDTFISKKILETKNLPDSSAKVVEMETAIVSNKFITKKKQERRLSRCFNEFKNNSRLSSDDDDRKDSINKVKNAKSQKIFSQNRPKILSNESKIRPRTSSNELKSFSCDLKSRPKTFSKTPETLLKSTLKKNHRKAARKNFADLRNRPNSSTSSVEEFNEGLTARRNDGLENTNTNQIWTNFSSSDDTGSSPSSDDGDVCEDLVNFTIARTIDKYTPEKLTVSIRYPHKLLDY